MTSLPSRLLRLLALPLLLLAAAAPAQARPFAVIFSSPGCEDCETVKKWWEEPAAAHGDVALVVVSMDRPANHLLLARLERELGVAEGSGTVLPALYAGGRLLYGLDAIQDEVEDLLAVEAAGHPAPESLRAVATKTAATTERLLAYDAAAPTRKPVPEAGAATRYRMAYFTLPGCQKCSRQELVLQALEAELPGLTVDRFDVTSARGRAALELVRQRFNLPGTAESHVPLLVWPDAWSGEKNLGPDAVRARLKLAAGTPFWEQPPAALQATGVSLAQQDLARMTVGLVAAAGLLDGINPCAFAVAIFLVSYLLYLGRSPREVILLGGSFCAGVFLAYLLLGIGLSFLLDWLRAFPLFKAALYGLIGAAGLLLGILHVRDAIRFRRSGRAKDMEMGLSLATTRRIHDCVRRFAGSRWLIPAGVALGCIISSLELACTGQIYLPTLAIVNKAGMGLRSLALLLLYNLAFILPLVAVTTLAGTGVSAKALAEWAKRNLVATKLAMALLFFVLGGVMLALAAHDAAQMRHPATAGNAASLHRPPHPPAPL
ncbi:MAG: hypothetical protein WC789_04260 [Lentisphaeria bacterium]